MMQGKGRYWIVAGLGAVLAVGAAHAQDDQGQIDETGIGLGPGLRLQPTIGTQLWATDNRFRSEHDTENEAGLVFDPGLTLIYAPGIGSYKLGYLGHIDPVASDDYNDRKVFTTVDIRPLYRHHFEFDAAYEYSHDEPGLNRLQGVNSSANGSELDKWENRSVNGQYTFGAPEAAMNVSVRGGYGERDYVTNRSAGTRFLDYSSTNVGGSVAYQPAPKTQVILDIEQDDFKYDNDANPAFDSTADHFLTGVRWFATEKTSGEVLVGWYTRNFDSDLRNDNHGIDWRAKVAWAPVSATTLSVTTGRVLRETVTLGENGINEKFAALAWNQSWTSRLGSEISVTYFGDDFDGTSRSDDDGKFRATMSYELSPQCVVKGGYELSTRSSTADNLDFTRNLLFEGLEFVF